RPSIPVPAASCCTVLSVFGVLMLAVIGLGFANQWEAFEGSKNDPEDYMGVATACYGAALVYAAFIVFCGSQIFANRRYSRIQI
ncbi:hypothetical protein BCV69DRAFT_243559, partial [Microstroma glucosiphilum]